MGKKQNMKKDITFYYTDITEYQTLKPIQTEAKKRGYATKFTEDFTTKSEIGIFCSHAQHCIPENSTFSVMMLHDMAQRHDIWPNIWKQENWNNFDVGILPNEQWKQRWQQSSGDAAANPKEGIYMVGWPKSDIIFNQSTEFKEQLEKMKKQLDLKHPITIIYAPSWASAEKQDSFVKALMDLPINLLLKIGAPGKGMDLVTPGRIEAIDEINKIHSKLQDNIHVIDRNINIMYCLALSDCIVSDESSCISESLLFDIPSISVCDWMIPDSIPPRLPVAPYDFVIKTLQKDLRQTVIDILEQLDSHKQRIKTEKNIYFANIGCASQVLLDLIDDFVYYGKSKKIKKVKSTLIIAKPSWKERIKKTSIFCLYKKNLLKDSFQQIFF